MVSSSKFTEDQKRDLATISASDKLRAAEWWRKNAPKKYKGLLDQDDGYEWMAALGWWLYCSELMDELEIRNAWDEARKNESVAETAARQLIEGKITLIEFQLIMVETIKNVTITASVIAFGGWERMSEAEWLYIGSLVLEQINYLTNFAEQVRNGQWKLNGLTIVRSKLYEEAGRSAFEESRRHYWTERGYVRERRILGEADHCIDCLRYAEMGWRPIGSLPKIGDSLCNMHCHCHFIFSKE